jgi:hypothetical protein
LRDRFHLLAVERSRRRRAMAPVELSMDVHCSKCVKDIKKAVKDLRGTYSTTSS